MREGRREIPNHLSLTHTGQSPPSHVCYACGAQGLDILARVHCGLQVSREIPGGVPAGFLSLSDACQQESLHLDQSQHYHTEHHCGETLDGPGEGIFAVCWLAIYNDHVILAAIYNMARVYMRVLTPGSTHFQLQSECLHESSDPGSTHFQLQSEFPSTKEYGFSQS